MAFYRGPHIVTDGLVFAVDAASPRSYPGSGATWTDIISKQSVTLTNSPTFSSDNGGALEFDGTSQYMTLASSITTPITGWTIVMIINAADSQSSAGWNYWFLQDPAGDHKYEFGTYGTTGNNFRFKDNIDSAGTGLTLSLGTGYCLLAFGVTDDGYSFYSYNGGNKGYSSNNSWSGGDDIVFDKFFNDGSSYYAASISNMLIYTKELSDDEILQNYNAFKTRLNT